MPFLGERERPEHVGGDEPRGERGQDVEHVGHAVEAIVAVAVLSVVLHRSEPGQIGRGLRVAERRRLEELARRVVGELLDRPRMGEPSIGDVREHEGRAPGEDRERPRLHEPRRQQRGRGAGAHLKSRFSKAAVARHSADVQ